MSPAEIRSNRVRAVKAAGLRSQVACSPYLQLLRRAPRLTTAPARMFVNACKNPSEFFTVYIMWYKLLLFNMIHVFISAVRRKVSGFFTKLDAEPQLDLIGTFFVFNFLLSGFCVLKPFYPIYYG